MISEIYFFAAPHNFKQYTRLIRCHTPFDPIKNCGVRCRHRENFGAFTGPKGDFGLILLILNMIIHMSFTGPTQFLPVNVRGPVSFAVFGDGWICRIFK